MLTHAELLAAVQKALGVFDTSKVWWIVFEVREQERAVELHARTRPADRYSSVASTVRSFDLYCDKEYLAHEIRRFVQESCGLGWLLVEVHQ